MRAVINRGEGSAEKCDRLYPAVRDQQIRAGKSSAGYRGNDPGGREERIPVSETIGDDYQAFCDSVLAEMPRMTGREKLLTIVRDICLFLAVWLPFWIFQYFGSGGTARVTTGDVGWAILVFATGYVYSWLMSRQAFKKHIGYLLAGVMFVAVVLIGAKVLSPNGYVLFTVHIYAAVAAEVILIIVCVILNRIVDQDYKTL